MPLRSPRRRTCRRRDRPYRRLARHRRLRHLRTISKSISRSTPSTDPAIWAESPRRPLANPRTPPRRQRLRKLPTSLRRPTHSSTAAAWMKPKPCISGFWSWRQITLRRSSASARSRTLGCRPKMRGPLRRRRTLEKASSRALGRRPGWSLRLRPRSPPSISKTTSIWKRPLPKQQRLSTGLRARRPRSRRPANRAPR